MAHSDGACYGSRKITSEEQHCSLLWAWVFKWKKGMEGSKLEVGKGDDHAKPTRMQTPDCVNLNTNQIRISRSTVHLFLLNTERLACLYSGCTYIRQVLLQDLDISSRVRRGKAPLRHFIKQFRSVCLLSLTPVQYLMANYQLRGAKPLPFGANFPSNRLPQPQSPSQSPQVQPRCHQINAHQSAVARQQQLLLLLPLLYPCCRDNNSIQSSSLYPFLIHQSLPQPKSFIRLQLRYKAP